MPTRPGSTLVQLSTVHSRNDTRVALKQCATIGDAFPGALQLVVADGLGPEERTQFEVVDLGRLGNGRLARAFGGFAAALRYIRRVRPAIVHFHDPELIPVGLVAKALGARVIYDVHEDVPDQIKGRYAIKWPVRVVLAAGARVAEWIGARVFDAIVPATPTIARRFPPTKTTVVQNFPLMSEFADMSVRPQRERPPAFVYVGWISRLRGAMTMARAISCLDWPDTELHMVGKFSPQGLQCEIEQCPASPRIRLPGWLGRGEVASLLGSSRAGLVLFHEAPNHVNAQPNKLFEYMAAGLPVIASNFPLWRRLVEDTGCGLVVDPKSPDDIAGAMRWILEHPAEAEEMGRRGRQAIETRFNWSSEGEKIVCLYRGLLEADEG